MSVLFFILKQISIYMLFKSSRQVLHNSEKILRIFWEKSRKIGIHWFLAFMLYYKKILLSLWLVENHVIYIKYNRGQKLQYTCIRHIGIAYGVGGSENFLYFWEFRAIFSILIGGKSCDIYNITANKKCNTILNGTLE